jgi:endonuclease/exonuclease/phosphatase (EEP) superfamily protein YafD
VDTPGTNGAPTDAGPPAPYDGAAPLRPSAVRRTAAWCAALLLLVPTAVIACRLADTDAVTPVPQLLAFLPWMLVPAGAALLFGLLARRRALMAWAAAVLAVTGWFVRPYDTGLTDDPPGPVIAQLEVLTSNVEFGGATEALVATVRREQPDLVFVQECEYRCAAALEAEISRGDYPYRNVVEGGGASGSAILSKHPLRPEPGIPSALAMPGSVAVIAGRDVNVQLAHPLPPVPEALSLWRTELGRLRDWAASAEGAPTLLAGDFNATQDHAAFRHVLDAGRLRDSATLAGAAHTPTWPATVRRPFGTQIDHVLVSEDFSVRDARFVDLPDTDHRAVLVRLELHDVR